MIAWIDIPAPRGGLVYYMAMSLASLISAATDPFAWFAIIACYMIGRDRGHWAWAFLPPFLVATLEIVILNFHWWGLAKLPADERISNALRIALSMIVLGLLSYAVGRRVARTRAKKAKG